MDNHRKKPIFIVGVQRSGSTLLRLILNAHSGLAIPEEARFLMPLLKKRHLGRPFSGKRLISLADYISANPQFKLWNYESVAFISGLREMGQISLDEFIDRLYSSYAASEGKERWGDKSLFFRSVDVLYALFPEARFIHIVRDGRDVFDSWRKMDPSGDNAAVAALDWRYKLHCIERSFSKLPAENHMTLRYEEMLERPQESIRSVCVFAGLPYEPGMLRFHETSKKYVGAHHSSLIFKPLDKGNIFKWKKNLTLAERGIFTCFAKGALARYGYDTGDAFGVADFVRGLALLVSGLPLKLAGVVRVARLSDRAAREGSRFDSSGYGALDVGSMPEEARGHKKGEQDG